MRQINLLEDIGQIADLLDSDLSLEDMLESVGKVIRAHIPADRMVFRLVQLGLRFKCGQAGIKKTPIKYWHQKDNVSAMRWVLAHGKSLKRDNLVEEERFAKDKVRIRHGIKSQMIVPLVRDNDVIGTMYFASKSIAQFTDAHLEKAELFVRLISAQVHQLYLRQETAGIGQLSLAIQSSSDLDHILMLVLEHIQSLGYDRVRIYLYDEQGDAMVGAKQVGISPLTCFENVRLPMANDPHSQRTFENFEPCIFHFSPRLPLTHIDPKSIFGDKIPEEKAELPLFVVNNGQNRIVGKISLDNVVSGKPIRQDDLKRLMIYAAQTANAIWKAQMYQEMKLEVEKRTETLRARAKQREGLLRVNRDVQRLQRSGDIQGVILSFFKNLADMGFDFRVLTIHRLIDEQRKIFEAYEVMDGHIYRKHVTVHERAFNIWKKGHVHYRRNLHEDLVDLLPDFIERAQRDIGCILASTLGVPLGRGVISMLSTSVEAFDEDDIHLFEQLAGILSVGLDRVHDLELVEKENQRQAALAMISQAVQKMKHPNELSNVARVYLDGVKNMGIEAHAVAIHRIVDADALLVESTRVLETGEVILAGARTSNTLVKTWREGRPHLESNMAQKDIKRLPNFQAKFHGHPLHSFVNVPFSWGVISVLSKEPDAFSILDVEGVESIADILSVGVRRLEDMEALEKQYKTVQENESRYRNLIRLIGGVAYMCDWRTHEYVYIDPRIEDLIDCDVETLTPDLFEQALDEEISVVHNEPLPSGITLTGEGRDPTVYRAEYQVTRADGSLVRLADFAIEFRDVAGHLVYTMGVVQDITMRHVQEESMRQSQKMEAIGQLAGGVAHDFNNLLTGILGLASLVLLQLPKDNALRSDIEEIQMAGQRAADLTKQLLAFSRKEMIEPQILDVNDVVSGMQNMLRRLIREDIDLTVSMTSTEKCVKIDQGQLEQVIMNLVVNAKDAMLDGGILAVKTDCIVLDAADIRRIPELVSGPYVTIEVCDTGIGMDRETQRRIFEPFFTTKEQGQGTGLGLATVYGIVAQNEGHIDVESRVGKGTVFKIYLPQVDNLREVEEEDCVDNLYRGDETVLVVEDEKMVRQFVSRALDGLGYTVWQAENGEAALDIFQEKSEQIDLLITDMVMPVMGGKALVEKLRGAYACLSVVYMSGYVEEMTSTDREFDAKASMLKKPFTADVLAQTVRQVLDRGKT